MHSTQELEVMDMFHNVEKTIEKIEDGTMFAERIVEHGSGAELLSLKKMIKMQLMSLINNTPKPDVNIKINFHTDQDKFEEAITRTFGSFIKDEEDQKVNYTFQNFSFVTLCWTEMADGHLRTVSNCLWPLGPVSNGLGGLLRPLMPSGLKSPPWSTH